MSIANTCMDSGAFPVAFNLEKRLLAMVHKFAFIEMNKYLKDNNIIARYKKNISLSDTFTSGYSKTVSSMVRDLIVSKFTGIDIERINLEKMRGYPTYTLRVRLPDTQVAVDRLVESLTRIGNNMVTWTTWRVRPGSEMTLNINFAHLGVALRYLADEVIPLQTFIVKLTELARLIRPLCPAPVVVQAVAPVTAVATVVGDTVATGIVEGQQEADDRTMIVHPAPIVVHIDVTANAVTEVPPGGVGRIQLRRIED